jgi:hypothetical protein
VLLALNDRIGTTVDLTLRTITDEFELAGGYGEFRSDVAAAIEAGGDARDAVSEADWAGAAAIYLVGDAWFTVPDDVQARPCPEGGDGVIFNVPGESVESVVKWLTTPEGERS